MFDWKSINEKNKKSNLYTVNYQTNHETSNLALYYIFFILIFLCVFLKTTNAVSASCSEGQYLVRTHYRSGYFRSSGTYVSPTTVKAYCKDYRNFEAPILHFPEEKLKTDSRSKEGYKKFSKSEKEKIQEIIKSLPKVLTAFGDIKFYRKKEGRVKGNPASVNSKKKEIILYDSISKHDMKRVIAHELAHILYNNLSDKEQELYRKVSQWNLDKKTKKIVLSKKRTVFTEKDGINSATEDFANNVEYYLFDEKTLRKKNKEIHGWIKKFMEKNLQE